MTLDDINDKTVGVLGFGQEGQAVASYLISKGITPKIYDGKALPNWTDINLAKLKDLKLEVVCEPNFIEIATAECEILFRSPGIKVASPIKPLITSQTQWFFEHCPAKIIGVTGTKGKGTTASLLYEILQTQNGKQRKVYLTGNIGKTQPFEFMEQLSEDDLVIYELSSFQLQDLKQSPQIGICLMVTSDHLDYHADLGEYHSAKFAIAQFQNSSDVLIYNADYEATKLVAKQGHGQKLSVSKFSDSHFQPTAQIIVEDDREGIEINYANKTIFIDTSKRLIKGQHNLENIAAAALAANVLNVSLEDIQTAINNFHGLKHRLQFVQEKAGVKYFNDSVSTNPDTTMAAIRSFAEPLVLIVGGAEKNLDYSNLAKEIVEAGNIKVVITMGPAGKTIQQLLLENGCKKEVLGPYYDFSQVVNMAQKKAKSGEVVLLSPAATSFDMFNSYAERGDTFIKIAESLP